MIVVDTGAMLALLDADEDNHADIRELWEEHPDEWTLPWAVLPEVDYLVSTHLGVKAQEAFIADLVDGVFSIEFGRDDDIAAAHRIHTRYRSLKLGLVDAMVIATAERLKARAIATLDLRHFGAVAIKGNPQLLPAIALSARGDVLVEPARSLGVDTIQLLSGSLSLTTQQFRSHRPGGLFDSHVTEDRHATTCRL